MARPLANLQSHGWARVAALVLFFGLSGPGLAVAPFLLMAGIGGLWREDSTPWLLESLAISYEMGVVPAAVTGLAVPMLFPRDFENTLPRVWAAAAIGMAGLAILLPFSVWGPGRVLQTNDFASLGFGFVLALVILALPAATFCWMIGRKLRLL